MATMTTEMVKEIETLDAELSRVSELAAKAAKAYDGPWDLLGGDDEDEAGLTDEEREAAQEAKVLLRQVHKSVGARLEAVRLKLKEARGW